MDSKETASLIYLIKIILIQLKTNAPMQVKLGTFQSLYPNALTNWAN